MNNRRQPSFDSFRSYLDAHLDAFTRRSDNAVRPVVTISREAGAGGHSVAERVARRMEHAMKLKAGTWSVVDEDLAEKVLEDHDLPKRLAGYMPEKVSNHIQSVIEELVGLHPSQWTLAQHTAETLLYLAELGNVVLVGRGGHLVTRKMPHAYHYRLVGSQAQRTHRLMDLYGIDNQKAQVLLHERDHGRRSYVHTHFQREVSDPHDYHMVINTDRVSYDAAARVITDEIVADLGKHLAHAA